MSRLNSVAPFRLLYVDDDRIGMLLMTEMLRQDTEIELRCAEDGAEACQIASEWTPNLLLLDTWLPDTDGFELLGQLRALPDLHDVPAVMCSADADVDALTRAKAGGFADFWAKPMHRATLRQSLERWMAASDERAR